MGLFSRKTRSPDMLSPPVSNGATSKAQIAETSVEYEMPPEVEVVQGQPVAVDVEQRKWDEFGEIRRQFSGQDDPFALAKLSQYERDQLMAMRAIARELERKCGEDLSNMLQWTQDKAKGRLNARSALERFGDNLSRPAETRSILSKMFGK